MSFEFPVMLQIGTESPRDLYVTDALAAVLPDVRIEELPGQAHEGMTTAPEMYAEAVSRFLLSIAARSLCRLGHPRWATAIKTIEEAPFLSAEQKRGIFYNNAARFLRLNKGETARHHRM